MDTNLLSPTRPFARWKDMVGYLDNGAGRRNVCEDANCKVVLVSVASTGPSFSLTLSA